MTVSALPTGPRLCGIREQLATRVIFFVAALPIVSWAPLVPLAKARLQLSDGDLGLLLLCIGIGSLIGMPVTGVMIARTGFRRIILVAGVTVLLAFPFLAVLASIPAMVVVLMVFGAALGSLEVAMNLQASIVERDSGRPMMSGFHGMWSIGGIFGAGAMSFMLGAGLPALVAAITVSAVGLSCLATAAGGLLPHAQGSGGPMFVIPKGFVFLIGLLCFLVFLAEHSVIDWSAVFLTAERGAGVGQAGLGFTIFAVAMTAGRLTGDRLRAIFGERKILLASGVAGAAGLLIVVLTPSLAANLAGFALLGAGCSNVVPVLFSITARTTAMPPNLALTGVATLTHLGGLLGPALIGFIAQATSLKVSFIALAAGLLAVAASYRIGRPQG